MKKWTRFQLDRLAKDKLTEEKYKLWSDPPRSTLEEWEESCRGQAQLFAKMTRCNAWEVIHRQFLELLQLQKAIRDKLGRDISIKDLESNNQEGVVFLKTRKEIARQYGFQKLCHVNKKGFVCYCDEHEHGSGR